MRLWKVVSAAFVVLALVGVGVMGGCSRKSTKLNLENLTSYTLLSVSWGAYEEFGNLAPGTSREKEVDAGRHLVFFDIGALHLATSDFVNVNKNNHVTFTITDNTNVYQYRTAREIQENIYRNSAKEPSVTLGSLQLK